MALHVILQPKEGNKDRWEILIEGEKWREVHRTVFGKHPTFPVVQSMEEWPAVFDAVEYQRAKGYVVWRLSAQSYHSELLVKLLRDRLVQRKTIDKVMRDCHQAGYFDDENWLKNYIQMHQSRYGWRFIATKLKAKGLSVETLEGLFEEGQDPEEERQAIRHLLETRYRSKDLSQFKEKQKVIGALLRKGFSYEQVKEAMETLK